MTDANLSESPTAPALAVTVQTTVTSDGPTTVTFELYVVPDTDRDEPTVIARTRPIPKGELIAGRRFPIAVEEPELFPQCAKQQRVSLRYQVKGALLSGGSFRVDLAGHNDRGADAQGMG